MSTSSTEDSGGFTPVLGTVAGTGIAGFKGDNELAASAQLDTPFGVVVDSTGTLYFSDCRNNRVRKVTTDGKISTVAGTGTAGDKGDGGPAVSAQLNGPREVAVDSAGNLYIADTLNEPFSSCAAGVMVQVSGVV